MLMHINLSYLQILGLVPILTLKPYLGEEDELPSRTTLFQEGEDDEDINTIVTPTAPSAIHT